MCSAHVLKRQLIVLAGVLLPLCTVLPAEEIYSAPAPEPLKSRLEERSLRRRLAERGVEYEAGYTAEYFGKLRGGLRSRRGGEYLGSVDAALSLDLSKAGVGRGQFFLGAQSLHGRGVNESWVGALQSLSSLDDAGFTRVTEAWYSDEYFHGRLRTRLGRQYADSEFGVIENGSEFINASYGLMPNNPMPTYPRPVLGASAWVDMLPWMSFGAGVFRGSETGPYTLSEVKIEPVPDRFLQSAIFRFGFWRQANDYGVYGTADYWFRKPSEEEPGGPGLFLHWGLAPEDPNGISDYVGGGISYRGAVRKRPEDVIGVGVTSAATGDSSRETAVEVFYKWQAASKIAIQPDLQWVLRPGGGGPHSVLFGIRMNCRF
ncbi:MAG: carbohydrate porin [Acidobacteria bacterium]|nr:carbohydrate porin [Acidobacteriota bacterium]